MCCVREWVSLYVGMCKSVSVRVSLCVSVTECVCVCVCVCVRVSAYVCACECVWGVSVCQRMYVCARILVC